MAILPLASVDEEWHLAKTAAQSGYVLKAMGGGIDRGETIAAIENVPEALTYAGEWVLNSKEKKLYLWPLGEKPGDEIFAPSLMELVRVEGDVDVEGPTDTPVHGIVFDGLAFTQGDRYVVSDDLHVDPARLGDDRPGPRTAPPTRRGRLPNRELPVLQQRRRSHPARPALPTHRRHPQRAQSPRLLRHPAAWLRPRHEGCQQEQCDREQPSPSPGRDLLAFPRDHRAPERGEPDRPQLHPQHAPQGDLPLRRAAAVLHPGRGLQRPQDAGMRAVHPLARDRRPGGGAAGRAGLEGARRHRTGRW